MFEISICTRSGTVLRRYDLSAVLAAGRKVRIGRNDDCDICIKASGISRYHCQLSVEDGDACILRDTGSTHGTYINGMRIEEIEIEPGLAVQVGPAILLFEAVTPRIAAAIEQELADTDLP
jgi:pSer/pThr/pTyr-binding forkhead associated (FHA) protein